eukprot:298152-Amorphochlora_amoeboformis.AAC.1
MDFTRLSKRQFGVHSAREDITELSWDLREGHFRYRSEISQNLHMESRGPAAPVEGGSAEVKPEKTPGVGKMMEDIPNETSLCVGSRGNPG